MPTVFFPDTFLKPDRSTFFQENWIARYVPEMYKTGEFEGLLQLIRLLAPVLDDLHERIIQLPHLVSPEDAPAEFLQYLADLVKYDLPTDWLVDDRRRELGKAVDVHKIRAIEYSFQRILKYDGAEDYGIFYPFRHIMWLDIHPMDAAAIPGETNDSGEPLASVKIDCIPDGISPVSVSLPFVPVKSNVIVLWNGHPLVKLITTILKDEVNESQEQWTIDAAIGSLQGFPEERFIIRCQNEFVFVDTVDIVDTGSGFRVTLNVRRGYSDTPTSHHPAGSVIELVTFTPGGEKDEVYDVLQYRYYKYDSLSNSIISSFVPRVEDTFQVLLQTDPYYQQAFYMEDADYWRPGVTDVYSTTDPLRKRDDLEDRRPIGTRLYFTWIQRYYIGKKELDVLEHEWSKGHGFTLLNPEEGNGIIEFTASYQWRNELLNVIDWSSTTEFFSDTSILMSLEQFELALEFQITQLS